ncbi:MAG: sel1 repeat family protein [Rhodospirillales bacterium]|nr:sel1 repeat family protein [Rhodospirillales bacterium]
MRKLLFLFAVATLGLSGFAGWFFFGGPDDDPTRIKMAAAVAEIEALIPKAKKGDVKVQYQLASLYYRGKYGPKDFGAAFKWFSRAAEKGHTGAQYAVGAMYAKGESVPQSYFRAAEWYKLSANLGHNVEAQLALGHLYFKGQGVPHDYAEALDWYTKAAHRGQPVAQHYLGAMYAEGWAGEFDAVRAYQWFTLAARQKERVLGYDPKLDSLAARARLATKMNQNQIKRATEAAENWRPRR